MLTAPLSRHFTPLPTWALTSLVALTSRCDRGVPSRRADLFEQRGLGMSARQPDLGRGHGLIARSCESGGGVLTGAVSTQASSLLPPHAAATTTTKKAGECPREGRVAMVPIGRCTAVLTGTRPARLAPHSGLERDLATRKQARRPAACLTLSALGEAASASVSSRPRTPSTAPIAVVAGAPAAFAIA